MFLDILLIDGLGSLTLASADTMKLCNHQGHLCPGPPCGLGPRHHKWECTNNDDDTTDDTTGYTTTDDTAVTGSSSGTTTTTYYDYDVTGEEDQSGNGSTTAASSFFSAMAYLAAGAAVAGIVGAIIFKKRVSDRICMGKIVSLTF